MKAIKLASMAALTASAAYGGGLYQVSEETESSIPLQWSVGMDVVWDDNTSPGPPATDGDETFSLNPFVGATFASVTPQTTMALYARLGLVYYLDQPAGTNDDVFGQSRVGFDLTHRFTERLRYTSRNYIAYEIEPDYTQGFGTNRQLGEYLYWSTDNSIGFRWSERFATYTGITLTGLEYDDIANADRFTWTAYNQLRYQLSPQTVLTGSYRYSETTGSDNTSDSTNQYLLIGAEHRVSANTIFVLNTGAQFRELERAGASSSTSPYVEFSMRTQVNQDWGYRAFVRYGAEDYDTIVQVGAPLVTAEYANKSTLRVGVSGEYKISPRLALFGGVNVVASSYEDGNNVVAPFAAVGDQDEVLVNAYVGSSLQLFDNIYGTLTYNFTNSSSDIVNRDYDRNRISVGVRAEF
jgi:hypothetical protein